MRVRNLGWLLVGLLSAPCALAALGQDESSVESDRKGISGVRHADVATRGAYSVREIANDHLTVREYLTSGAAGKVFAITWSGERQPDLTALLGSYFGDYENASQHASKAKGRRASSRVQGDQVIVEKSGHPRWAQGKAYVPGLLPEGVDIHDLQ